MFGLPFPGPYYRKRGRDRCGFGTRICCPFCPGRSCSGSIRNAARSGGLSWGKKHAVVDYVFVHPPEYLILYHLRVMMEMARRGYRAEPCWASPGYRGRRCEAREIDTALMALLAGRRRSIREHGPSIWRSAWKI